MGNARTTSLHECLPVALRRQVERDLVEQPPGRESYRKVYEHYDLGQYGVSIKALERYGGYLRAMARNRWIGQIADAITGRDLSDDVAGLVRARLFEALTIGETSMSDLLKAAMAESHLARTRIAVEQWEQAKHKAAEALEAASKAAETDPVEAYRRLREDIAMIYGVGQGDEARESSRKDAKTAKG